MTDLRAGDRHEYKVFNDEVLYAEDSLVKVDRATIQFLKDKARDNERQRIRLCAHQDVQHPLHEMLIVHAHETYVRPHKHLRCESFHVIEGAADVVLFDDAGQMSDVIRLGDYASGHTFYYRLREPLFHTVIVRSEIVVFHETKQGPFVPSETTFASWAPDGDEAAQRAFVEDLTQAVGRFLCR